MLSESLLLRHMEMGHIILCIPYFISENVVDTWQKRLCYRELTNEAINELGLTAYMKICAQYKHDNFFQRQFSIPDEYFFWRAS